jgi:hypothetical protein
MKNTVTAEVLFIAAGALCLAAAGCFVGLDAASGNGDGGANDDAGTEDRCANVGAPNYTCCSPDGTEAYPFCRDGAFFCPDGYAEGPLDSCGDLCAGLDYCRCLAESSVCEPVADGCLCDCDYDCNPAIDCACKCGGGTYLGCREKEPVAACPDNGTCVPGVLPPGPIATGTRCPAPHDDLFMTGPACEPAGGGDGFCCTPESTCYLIGAPFLTCCGPGGAETAPACALGVFYCPDGYEKAEPGTCERPACEGLDFCACHDRDDCAVQAEDCLCPCDYDCPGDMPCDCDCGGGKYLGCAARLGTCADPASDCPGAAPVKCPGGWACDDAKLCGYRCDAEPYCLYDASGVRTCAAASCQLGKISTSGMTDGFGIGKSCEFLVVCASTPIDGTLRDAIIAAFPGMDCGGTVDYTCGQDAVASCIAFVETLTEAQAGDVCRLSGFNAVVGLVCAGDL